jgi:Zn-dependent peptidase ImmA (M78 family)
MIGERIKQARVAAGFSLRQLAEVTNNYVSAQVIHKYELGKVVPGSDVLIKIAKALGVKVEYFFRAETVQVTLSGAAYRKRAVASAKHLNAVHAKAKEFLERYLAVEALFPTHRFPKLHLPADADRKITHERDIESLAVETRKRWQLGTDPILDLTEVLEDKGVKVVMMEGEESFDGLSCWANETIPVVVVKKNQLGDRLRFSLAHEFGHLLMNVPASYTHKQREKAANRFAGAFLVPESAAKQELGETRSGLGLAELKMLKQKYGMSMQAWLYRAKDLNIISDSKWVEYNAVFRSRGWNKTEPGDAVAVEQPRRFERLILQALVEGLITPAKAAEYLCIPLSEFQKTLKVDLAETEAGL